MPTVDEVLRLFANPDCPECEGIGVVMGRVWGNGRVWFKDDDKICTCVPKITMEKREP